MLLNRLTLTATLAIGITSSLFGAGAPVWTGPISQTCTVNTVCPTVNFTLVSGSGTGAVTFALASGVIPTGMTLNATSVSGTPTAVGVFTFRISANDTLHHPGIENHFVINVTAAPIIIVDPGPQTFVTASPLPNASNCAHYATTLVSTGGQAPYTYAITSGALPFPLTMNSSGVISGAAGVHAGAYTFTVQSTDSFSPAHTASRTFVLNVLPCAGTIQPLVLSTSSVVPATTTCSATSLQLAATGGIAPYTFAVAAGSTLPSGVTLTAGGLLSGTPITAASYSFSLTVTDSNSPTSTTTKAFTYVVSVCPPPPPALAITTTSPLPTQSVCLHTPIQLAATGGVPGYTWTIIAGALPRPSTLSSGGLISGLPFHAGVYTFTVQVRDSVGTLVTQAYSWTINACGGAVDAPEAVEGSLSVVDGLPSFTLAQAATTDIDGTLEIFPANAEGEFAYFTNAMRRVSFNIKAGSTEAVFSKENSRLSMLSDGGVATLVTTLYVDGVEMTPEAATLTVRNNGSVE